MRCSKFPVAGWATSGGRDACSCAIVIWWSAFTAATGLTWNFVSLYVTQLLFGAGEAGCFPNITRAFSNWLPRSERVRAQGIIWLSARWGGAFTPILVAFLFQFLTWRQAFAAFGLLGVGHGRSGFYVWFRDNPRENSRCEPGGTGSAEVQRSRFEPRRSAVGKVRDLQDRLAALRTVLRTEFSLYFLINMGTDLY